MHLLWPPALVRWMKKAPGLLAVAACVTLGSPCAQAEFRPMPRPSQGLSLRLFSDATVGLWSDGREALPTSHAPAASAASEIQTAAANGASDACPAMIGASLGTMLDWVQLAAEKSTELTQDWIRHFAEAPRRDRNQFIAPQVARLSENVGANSDASSDASSGDALPVEPAAWCGTMLTLPSGERTTESQEESNCAWAGCGGLGPLQWPSPDGGWRRVWFLTNGGSAVPQQAAQAAETTAISGSIAHLLTGREHVAGAVMARHINALNDGLLLPAWQRQAAQAWAAWRPAAWQWPTVRATDLAAVRSLYFWWDSAQPHRRADSLTNDAARPAPQSPAAGEATAATAATAAIEVSASPSQPMPNVGPFEPIIDGPWRFLYLRSEWSPSSADILARAQSALSVQETAPACGADGDTLNDPRAGDPLEQWVGCDAYARYAHQHGVGISAEETARWLGRAVTWSLSLTGEFNAASAQAVRFALEFPRLTAQAATELAILRRAADALASAGGAGAKSNASGNVGQQDSEAKRIPAAGEPRGF